mmetsp:Transcript_103426/g.205579  ORF Transcript_103426/g.205579 Transcript_103426/m.205579 type:complete len:198 (+) Transcript_103426:59-652(+)
MERHVSFLPPPQCWAACNLELADRLGSCVAPPLQYDVVKLPDPMYVHINDCIPQEEIQVSAGQFTKLVASARQCGAEKNPVHVWDNPSSNRASRTLLIAYIPRCASTEALENIFRRFGTVCLATIVCEGNGQSKCFGFVSFANHAAANSALLATATGRVILEDENSKVWHLKASWAREEQKTRRSRLATARRRNAQR